MLNASVFRPLWRSLVLTVLTALVFALPARAATVDDGFNPNVNGPIFAVVPQPDGQVLIAGAFSTITPNNGTAITRNNIARLKADGSLDLTFDPNANFQVSTMVLQPNGQILIGGKFTVLQPNGIPNATLRNHIARLNADGTLDQTFDPNTGDPSTGGSLTPQVNAIVLQPNGRILVAGGFTSLQPNGAATATPVNRIARLNADGTIDATFNPNVTVNNMVWALALQPDGKILFGGGFTGLKLDSETAPPTRDRIARLNRDGTLDLAFNCPNPDNLVSAITLYRDNRIVIGGNFAKFDPDSDSSTDPVVRNHLAGLTPNGTIDTTWVPDTNGNVTALAVQSDGKLLVAGYFTVLRSNDFTTVPARSFIGRYNTDGSLDLDFTPGANYAVLALGLQADDRILLGGNFTTIQSSISSLPTTRNRLARVNANGSLDKTFEPDSTGRPFTAAVQPDGQLIVAGNFASIGGVTRRGLGRIKTDGTVDPTFTPVVNGPVRAVLVQSDGKLVIGGGFTSVTPSGSFTPVVRAYLARLNSDGTVDGSFNPTPNGQIYSLALQSDGILVGGTFSTITRHNNVDPITTDSDSDVRYRSNLARIKLDGTLDDNFDPTPNGAVSVIKIQTDGKILIGGSFISLQPNGALGSTVSICTARLNPDGTLATHFDPAPNGTVSTLAIQSDGKIIIGGNFTEISRHNNIDPDPKDTDNDRVTRNRIARVNADGTLDTTYDPNVNGQILNSSLQTDGKLLIGGGFTTIQANGAATATTRQYLARLNTDGTLDAGFDAALNVSPDNQITSIVTGADGKIVIVGGFTSVHSAARTHLARLNADGTPDNSFDLAVGGNTDVSISALAVQSDGKVIAGGKFGSYGGSTSQNLARFLPDSSPDTSFSADVDGPVNAILVPPLGVAVATQSNGLASLTNGGSLNTSYPANSDAAPTYNFSALLASRIVGQVRNILIQTVNGEKKLLVAGTFTTNNSAVGGNLVRFNEDGTLDTSFNPAPDGNVQALALDEQGRILVGGSFTNITGVAHAYFARLNADGTLDAGFTYTTDAQVSVIIVQPDDHKILISGYFQYLTLTSGGAVTTRSYVARLNTDGTIDSFDPKANAQVVAMVLQPDKKVLLGGYFTTMQSNGAGTAVTRNSISRANADGTLDTNFDPNLDGGVSALALQIDPATGQTKSPLQIVVGGAFTSAKPNGAAATARSGILRLNADGSLDPDFHPNANGSVLALAVQPDGNVLLGGSFTSLRPDDSARSITRNYLARVLYANGAVDASFDPNANAAVSVITLAPDGTVLVGGGLTGLQPSGAILIGGSFTTANGLPVANLAFLNSDGTTNTTVVPSPDAAVNALLLEPDGQILVGGAFAHIGGAQHGGLARIKSDNTIDPAFTAGVTGSVRALARQADGRVLLGGAFTAVNSAARANLGRINDDGTLDATFAPSVPGTVNALLVQPDGNILVAYDSSGTGQLMRLKPDGTADSTFSSAATGSVGAIALRTDGLIYVGGGQTGAGFLQRLTATGALDPAFISPAPDGAVSALTLQSDGKLVAGGAFATVDGRPRLGLARFSTDASAFDSVTVSADRTVVTFNHAGSGPQLVGATIDYSTDNRVWNPVGTGTATRVGTTGGWQVGGASLPAASTYYYIRVRGIIPGTQYSSSSLYEFEREFFDSVQITSPTAVGAVAGAGFLYATSVTGAPTGFAATGLPAGLSIDPDTGLITGTPTTAGTYSVTVTAYSAGASSTITLVIVVATPAAPTADSRLINVSTNITASNAHPIIAGFVISGTEPRSVLLRAMGPSMAALVPSTVLALPRLDVYARSNLIYTNAGWGGAQALSTLSDGLGASPPLTTTNQGDSAIALTLQPGVYSIVIGDASGANQSGTVLTEVYDASMQPGQGASRIVNLSSRGYLSAANTVLIGGFVLQATAPASPTGTTVYRRILVRGIGPQLIGQGVFDAIADPQLSLFDSHSHLLVQNNDWETPVANTAYPPATGLQIAAAASTAGAFTLDGGSKDAALLVTLPIVIAPNAASGTAVYSAQVSNLDTGDGSAMVEIYELPSN